MYISWYKKVSTVFMSSLKAFFYANNKHAIPYS